jgi:adenosylcobyric acid synthase
VIEIDGRMDGARSADGRVAGVYVHGLFGSDGYRTAWLSALGATGVGYTYGAAVEDTLDALADHLEAHADLDGLLDIARAG